MRKQENIDKKARAVVWLPDEQSVSKNAKKCSLTDLQHADSRVLAVGDLGTSIADEVRPVVAKRGSVHTISAIYAWERHGLKWDLRAELEHDGEVLIASSAKLEV